MDNLDNIRTLAETSLEAHNYEQAYQYYSKLLENNPNEYSYWYGKGISAGWCSTASNPRFDELIVCIKQALKNDNKNQLNKQELSTKILSLCEDKLKNILMTIDKEVNAEFDKKPMGTGELYAIHQTAKIPIQLDIGNRYSPVLIKVIDTMEFACQIYPSTDGYKRIINAIDKIFQHSLNNSNYFKIHKEAGDRFEKLVQRRQLLIQKGKELDSEFTVGSQPDSKSGGCFIATATMGDYNHPYVLTFRKYRDDILLSNSVGRFIISLYYLISPPIANFISKNSLMRNLTLRLLIKPLYKYITKLLFEK